MRRAALGVVVLLLGVLLAAFLLSRGASPAPAPLTPALSPAEERGGAASPGAAAPAPSRPSAPSPSPSELPRPAPRAAEAPAPVSIAQAVTARRGPVDKRGDAGPRAAAQLEMISYAFETLDDDVEECLAEWRKSEPQAPAEVMLGFDIDGSGLQRSWVDADGGVPFGVRTCFANAVYGLDWSHIVDQPAMVTKRFNLGDAGE